MVLHLTTCSTLAAATSAATAVLIVACLSSLGVATSFPYNESFPNCSQTFSCGSLTGLSYPFFGGPRPSYCGLPDFHLTCRPDHVTVLTSKSVSYRVVRVDQDSRTLTLSRLDLFDTTCTSQFSNTTLDDSIFSFSSDNQMLTLFYGCKNSSNSHEPENKFSCNINGISTDSYYLITLVPNDPILSIIYCNVSVQVPILSTWGTKIWANRSFLGEVLRDGFNVHYTNPYSDDCDACRHDSHGQCGVSFGSPICICNDRICAGAKKQQISMGAGLGIAGAVLTGICLGCWFMVLIQRRRKRKAAEMQSKDLPTPPSSKDPNTTKTSADLFQSQSIPSYPSSKTADLEKGSTYFGVQVFSYTELEEATDNFDQSKELGDGGFGTVYHGVLKDGRVVAVKRLYENNMKRAEQFMNEIEILTRLRHKNLVTLYGCTSRRSRELLLVYEYIPNGTVADHLHGKLSNSGLLPWTVRLNIAIETANALAYLHASDVIHRDVKTNNILLDNDFTVKVADFGLSRLFPNDVTHVSTAPQGTPGYVDPEYYQCYQLTDKSDVYSFGVVLIELISSLEAVDTNRHRQDINLANMAISKIQNHAIKELVDPSLGFENDYAVRRMATLVAELAFRCLQQERDMRPTMQEVLDALKKIEREVHGTQKPEVVDIVADDAGLLRNFSPPLSPDFVHDKLDVKVIRTM